MLLSHARWIYTQFDCEFKKVNKCSNDIEEIKTERTSTKLIFEIQWESATHTNHRQQASSALQSVCFVWAWNKNRNTNIKLQLNDKGMIEGNVNIIYYLYNYIFKLR